MIINEEEYLAHYGTQRKSGRYPWGSGENRLFARNQTFLDHINDLESQGLTEQEIAKGFDMSTTDLRDYKTISKMEIKHGKISQIQRLSDKGNSNVAIGRLLNIPESTVRSLLMAGEKEETYRLNNTRDMLKSIVDEKKMVDVGLGTENYVGITSNKLKTVLTMLREEGYETHSVKGSQLGTQFKTDYKVLCVPGITQKDVFLNIHEIKQITDHSVDDGKTFLGIHPPIAISPNRVEIKFADEGGADKDGVIYVRPGVKDVDLGQASYAQVRIQVGDSHFIKGVAMYKDDLPKGVDLVFHTSKDKTDNKLDALKPLFEDADNPFGTVFKRQITEKDADGKDRVTSSMNIVYEEGDWKTWTKSISSQVLAKQSPTLAKSQLDMTYENRKDQLDTIKKLTNPTVRRKLLQEFSDETDSASVQLAAAALPRQRWHAILPIVSIPEGQVYAPNYRNGEIVALIRYPHGGTFEIPELVVNNKHPESRRLLGGAQDAIGIHPRVAERLSGADFDGDTVLVIPNGNRKIKSTPALEGLKGFRHRVAYPEYPGMKVMKNTQQEMGSISNLITDMTIRGAPASDITRAVRHSMVVIDAEKHRLNYKQSALDNNIKQLKEKYLIEPTGKAGASTLISRARSQEHVLDRKPRLAGLGGPIDKVTGELKYQPTGRPNYKTGLPKTYKSKALAETSDAHTLSSGTPIERLYADHSNRLKAMANQARLEMIKTPSLKYSPSAKKVYANEVTSLNNKLAIAISNKPLERQAQLIGGKLYKAKVHSNPDMDDKLKKKIRFQALEQARSRMGAKKEEIKVTQSEWDAIQHGAISDSQLTKILNNANMKVVRELAMPRDRLLMTSAKTRRAEAMLKQGYTRSDVADALGVSVSTLDKSTTATEIM